VSECDCEASIVRRPWPTSDFYAMIKKITFLSTLYPFIPSDLKEMNQI
jgi:hypothetical protein